MGQVSHIGEIALEDGGRLVLTDYYSSPKGLSNLRRLNADGSVCWHAQLRDSSLGHYVSFEMGHDRIFAQSFDCYRVEIDPNTGAALAEEFTK